VSCGSSRRRRTRTRASGKNKKQEARRTRTRGGAVSHSRGHIAYCPFSPPVAHSLNEAMREKTSQPVLFVDAHPSQCWLQVFSRGIWPGKIVEQVFSRIRLVYVEGVCCVCVGFHRTPQQQQPLASPNCLATTKSKTGSSSHLPMLPTACFADGAGLGGSCQRAPLAPWRRLLVDQHLRCGHNQSRYRV
jgi:hypothetical protein